MTRSSLASCPGTGTTGNSRSEADLTVVDGRASRSSGVSVRTSDRTVSEIRLGVSAGGRDQRLSEPLMSSTIGAEPAIGNGGAAESPLVRGSGAVAMISVRVVGYGIPRVA